MSYKFSDKATDGNLPSEDWAANIDICDIINETEEGYDNSYHIVLLFSAVKLLFLES